MNNLFYQPLIQEIQYISMLNNMQSLYFVPYIPSLHYFQNQQKTLPTSNHRIIRQFSDCGVQTDQNYNLRQNKSHYFSSGSEQSKENINQLPFPNKEKLFNVFQYPSNKRKDIQEKIDQLCNPKTKLLNTFYKLIGEKILSFKKTKQEIIKFLIRRAWKKQETGVGQAREKYYSQYKSMNSNYLMNVFSDQSFVSAYEEMLKDFENEFDTYNSQRFNRFYDYLLNCYVNNNLSQFKTSKQCKSKLPYPQHWKQHIRQIAFNLYQVYCQKSKQKANQNDKNSQNNDQANSSEIK